MNASGLPRDAETMLAPLILLAATVRTVTLAAEGVASHVRAAMTNEAAVVVFGSNAVTGVFAAGVTPAGEVFGPYRLAKFATDGYWPVVATNGRDVMAAWRVYGGGESIGLAPLDAKGRPRGEAALLPAGGNPQAGVGIAASGDRFLVTWSLSSSRRRWMIVDRDANPVGPVRELVADGLNFSGRQEEPAAASGQRFAVVVESFPPGVKGPVVVALLIDRDGNVAVPPVVVSSGSWPAVASEGDRFVVSWEEDDRYNVGLRALANDGSLGAVSRVFSIDGFRYGSIASDGSARVLSLASFCHFPCGGGAFWSFPRALPDGRPLVPLEGASCYCDSMAVAASGSLVVTSWGDVPDRLYVRFSSPDPPRSRAVRH